LAEKLGRKAWPKSLAEKLGPSLGLIRKNDHLFRLWLVYTLANQA
jgi:hypothetical protein